MSASTELKELIQDPRPKAASSSHASKSSNAVMPQERGIDEQIRDLKKILGVGGAIDVELRFVKHQFEFDKARRNGEGNLEIPGVGPNGSKREIEIIANSKAMEKLCGNSRAIACSEGNEIYLLDPQSFRSKLSSVSKSFLSVTDSVLQAVKGAPAPEYAKDEATIARDYQKRFVHELSHVARNAGEYRARYEAELFGKNAGGEMLSPDKMLLQVYLAYPDPSVLGKAYAERFTPGSPGREWLPGGSVFKDIVSKLDSALQTLGGSLSNDDRRSLAERRNLFFQAATGAAEFIVEFETAARAQRYRSAVLDYQAKNHISDESLKLILTNERSGGVLRMFSPEAWSQNRHAANIRDLTNNIARETAVEIRLNLSKSK